MRFKELYKNHGRNYICRELDITSEQFDKFRRKLLSY